MNSTASFGLSCGGLQAKVAASDVAGARKVYDEMAGGGGAGSTAAQAEALASLATALGFQGGGSMEVSALPRLF